MILNFRHVYRYFILNRQETLILRLFSSFNHQVQQKENVILKQSVVVHVKWPFPKIQSLELVGHRENRMV